MKKALLTLSAVLMLGITASAYSNVLAVSTNKMTYDEYEDSFDDYDYHGYDKNSYDYDSDLSDDDMTALIGFIVIYGIIILLIIIPLYIYNGFVQTAIAKKLHHKKPVWAWIPFLNIIQLFQMAELSPWLSLTILIPFLGIGIFIYAYWKIAERLGFPGWITLFMLINPIYALVITVFFSIIKINANRLLVGILYTLSFALLFANQDVSLNGDLDGYLDMYLQTIDFNILA